MLELSDDAHHDLDLEAMHAPGVSESLISASQTADLPNVRKIVLESRKSKTHDYVTHDTSYIQFMKIEEKTSQA